MLKAPAPYPYPGAQALLDEGGRIWPVRIIERHGEDAFIAIQGREGASAAPRRPVAALRDATPLDAAEQAELAALEGHILASKRPARARLARFEALRGRLAAAETYARLTRRAAA